MSDELQREIAAEQEYVDGLFDRLDDEVAQANERLRQVQLEVDPANPDADALVRRETEYHGLNAKLDRLNLAQLGLVFGRIDIATDDVETPVPGRPDLERRYIGRMGLDDRADNYRTLLLDWRAPMARPFYLATTAQPEGVTLRRHIRTRGRTVTGVDDEVLAGDVDVHTRQGVGSESALHHAMQRARTGHMRSIVETIQREQDQIIRDPSRGVMVVQGGPGTGKTAVALHRVAYLLYTHRDQLAKSGVLIIGPNPTFLDYISRVLPELGETGVVLSTVGDLFPGVRATVEESLLTREIKGSEEMTTILGRWVRHQQQIPEDPVEVRVESLTLTITPEMVAEARTRARRSRKPHNDAAVFFTERLVGLLATQLAERIGADPLGGSNLLSQADVDQLHDDLAEDPTVSRLVEGWWPELTPTDLLRALLEDADAIDAVAGDYDEETRAALHREPGSGWGSSDAALLDELAVLIGLPDPEEVRRAENEAWRQQVADAEDALDVLASSESTDLDDDQFEAEILSASDVIDADTLARRQEVTDARTTAERAAADHTWAFGHVIVDEAQELTPMEWRMVFRRSPSRWMTLVGDTAQTGAPAGVDSWAESLGPFVGGRFRTHELTVNYRTPAEIMEVANRILAVIDPGATPAEAIRESGVEVSYLPSGTDPASLAFDDVTAEEGLVQVIDQVNVATIKGLEFDHVIVVEPAQIVAGSPQGWQDLYVAVTRATQSLTVIGALPETD
ncbi:HelD family protein [Corynebacterium guangdongense]|uniref:DNA helicase IV n=1 Tax=Corynebacterium guangdongense TaxID=1783348 RepID=A0ABU1ZWK5_9CORY|nr:UvrD-helicase domain-containing protein [Corynebacterium guangdongense]MDR7329245.1 DNA helicase IV [Corynebacterium guangdongense]WJZ17811.1 Helicase IV [Corynebacterium guangdongense]